MAPNRLQSSFRPFPPELAGSVWTGRETYEQVFEGKTARVEVDLRLEFDQQGVALSLPALGMVSPWRLYVSRDTERIPLRSKP